DQRAWIAEDLLEGVARQEVREERSVRTDRQIPPRRRIEPRHRLEHAERFRDREVAPAQTGRQEDAEQPGVVQRLDDRRRELRVTLRSPRVLANQRRQPADRVETPVDASPGHTYASRSPTISPHTIGTHAGGSASTSSTPSPRARSRNRGNAAMAPVGMS